ncbi:MAG: DCC1-like thiol-disulfide oxidoreductase family protein [Planctomycetota bacterium]
MTQITITGIPHNSRMKNGWTGGAYSMIRALLGLRALWIVVAALVAGDTLLHPGVAVALIGAAIQLIIGWGDRIGALMIAFVFLATFGDPLIGGLAILHLTLPSKPYGSLAARGRPDPGGGWSWPARHRAVWFWMGLTWIGYAIYDVATGLSLGAFGEIWIPMTLWFLLWFDPGWIPPKRAEEKEHLFYDGHCGLCHRAIRFLLAEDRIDSFVFAPLAGDTFRSLVPEECAEDLPDSVIVRTSAGKLLVRSSATLHTLRRLGGYWRVLGTVFMLVPRPLRDTAYNFIASIRYRVWGKTPEACPVIPEALRGRFRA